MTKFHVNLPAASWVVSTGRCSSRPCTTWGLARPAQSGWGSTCSRGRRGGGCRCGADGGPRGRGGPQSRRLRRKKIYICFEKSVVNPIFLYLDRSITYTKACEIPAWYSFVCFFLLWFLVCSSIIPYDDWWHRYSEGGPCPCFIFNIWYLFSFFLEDLLNYAKVNFEIPYRKVSWTTKVNDVCGIFWQEKCIGYYNSISFPNISEKLIITTIDLPCATTTILFSAAHRPTQTRASVPHP